jgi:hypothetical protein
MAPQSLRDDNRELLANGLTIGTVGRSSRESAGNIRCGHLSLFEGVHRRRDGIMSLLEIARKFGVC